MLGWHFCREDKKLGFGDGRQIRRGRKLKVKPPIKLCSRGLHASRRIVDALSYSQGPIIARVELSGQLVHDKDKSVATERTVLQMADATKILHEFACLCTERALKKAKIKDGWHWNAIKTKRLWLAGKVTDKELATAWDAARDAERVAGLDATWDAAWDAVWDAARVAAWDAARVAERFAERVAERDSALDAAAGAAAWDAEKQWQNKKLRKMIMPLFKGR